MASWFLVVTGVVGGALVAAAASAVVLEARRQAADAARGPPGRMVDIGGGRRLHLVCLGRRGALPTVVMEAGGGNPLVYAQPAARRVAEFTQVCLYDRAGLGWSDPPDGPRGFDGLADDLHRLLVAADIEGPYVLEGASFGGLVVRAFARDHPEAVAGVVLTDAAEEALVFGRLGETMGQARRMSAIARVAARLGLVRRAVLRRPRAIGLEAAHLTPHEIRQAAAHLSRDSHWRGAAREAAAYGLTPDQMRRAGGFGDLGDRPLVVLAHGRPMAGTHQALEAGWRDAQVRLASLSTRGRLQVVEDASHSIGLERPDVVAEAIRSVCEEVARPLR